MNQNQDIHVEMEKEKKKRKHCMQDFDLAAYFSAKVQ